MKSKSNHHSGFMPWLMALLLSALAVGCGGGGGGQDPILGGGGNAALAPTVTAVAPLPNAANVPINTTIITAAFSQAMEAATLTSASFTLACPAGTPVAGTVSYLAAGNAATLTLPTATTLPPGTVCTATVTTVAKNAAGVALASNFVWTFTTSAALDTTAPTVSSTAPLANASGVAFNALTSASFSEPMDPLTITTASVRLACPAGTSVTGSVGYAVNGNVATFTPAANLPAGTVCTATVTTAAKDVAGNALAAPFTWNFTTSAAPDTTAPSVSSTIPLANAGGVALNARITASFSEAMDPLTITTANVKLACPTGTAITGIVGYAVNGSVATFTPAANLPASTLCTATITTAVKDVAGNALAANYAWNFTTGAAADTTAPTVSSTVPLPNATAVALNTLTTASFSEAMDPLTITTATLSLACPAGTPVTGTVGYATTGNVATITPTAALPAGTLCTATISTGVKDVAGNALATPFAWNFTTGVAADTTAPRVDSTVPVANASGVAVNTLATVSFSEPMDPLTITAANFSLACPAGTAVTGSVGYAVNGNMATFTPAANLPNGTICTATVSTGVKDDAGNALATPYTWSFTTGAAADTTAPTVSSTVPTANAVGIAGNTPVTASFSEAMDPLTITTANFSLACPNGAAITGTVGYATAGNVASFVPATNLPANIVCTATITTGAKDVAGNALAVPFTWNFTTVATAPTGPAAVNLGTAGNFVILAKSAVSTVPASAITGDVGVSPAATTFLTGFSLTMVGTTAATSTQVTGSLYGADMTTPTSSNLTTAVLDMQTAYTDAAGRPTPDFLNLGTGEIGGLTLVPGLYKWTTGVTISSNVTITGGANDVWIFQIPGNLTMSTAVNVTLGGSAKAKNIFWQVAGFADFGTSSHFEGIILSQTSIGLRTGASMNGRALAQTAVTLDQSTVTKPAP